MNQKKHLLVLLFLASLGFTGPKLNADPEVVHVAVASNFQEPLNRILPLFEEKKGVRVSTSVASSGILYSQIVNGAPYSLFFSADAEKVDRLVEGEIIPPDQGAIFVKGQIMLASLHSSVLPACGFFNKKTKSVSLANPDFAPYGLRAKKYLLSQGVDIEQSDGTQIILATNVNQSAQFLLQKSVDYAWLAASQRKLLLEKNPSLCLFVPQVDDSASVVQKMALLDKNNPGALALWNFMDSEEVRIILQEYGYLKP